jgi:hypothetical protein
VRHGLSEGRRHTKRFIFSYHITRKTGIEAEDFKEALKTLEEQDALPAVRRCKRILPFPVPPPPVAAARSRLTGFRCPPVNHPAIQPDWPDWPGWSGARPDDR